MLILPVLLLGACIETYDLNEAPPTAEDAVFTFAPSDENENIIQFSTTSQAFMLKWDLGNGSAASGRSVTGIYPLAGTYTVTLTAFTGGGSVSSSQEIVIAETDPTLLDKPLYNMLTGGADAVEGKTWVIDSARAGHFGVGPNPSSGAGDVPEWYAAGANEKVGGGMYDDRYTFYLADFQFEMVVNGDVYINGAQGPNFPGSSESPVGDLIAPFTPGNNLTWSMAEPEGEYPVLTISPNGFVGYFAGSRTYQILHIEENELRLRYVDGADDGLAWYLRLIPEGYDPGSGGEEPEPEEVALPLDFETLEPAFNTFGGSTAAIVDNPDKSGINTSDRVVETTHGGETWAGFFTDLAEPLDLSTLTNISLKVWAPAAGTFRLKLENPDDSGDFLEVDQNVESAEEWVELIFDISAATDRPLSRLVLFPGWDVANAGTFYIDDIKLSAGAADITELTDELLNGGGTKSWVIKPAAGAFGVGPAKGSDAYWPNGANISGDRPCLFNDLFIFSDGGEFEYDAQGDIFGEAYMGVGDGCQDEANLTGTDGEAWGSGTHAYVFTPADNGEPAKIAVTGTGAFIALPKAYNGGEYAAGPPPADATVTYEVLSYLKTASAEELTITIDVSGTGATYWNFTLIPAE